jgi:osmoprotectant transport system substrate-binding protein
MNRSRRVALSLVAAALAAGACGSGGGAAEPDPIVIGSFDTAESIVLGEVYRLELIDEAFPAVHRSGIGDRAELIASLRNGDVDFVLDYLGASLAASFGIEPPADAAQAYDMLAEAWFDDGFLAMLPTGAENRLGFAVGADTAASLTIVSLTDLATSAGDLTFGGPAACLEEDTCLPGLADTYGAVFAQVVEVEPGGVVAALTTGAVDVGPISTSDPAVDDAGLVILEDDRGLVPAEWIIPIVSVDASVRFGDELLAVIDGVSAGLEQRALIQLNRLVASGRSPEAAAAEWLLVNDVTG